MNSLVKCVPVNPSQTSQGLCVRVWESECTQNQINFVFIFHTAFGSAVRWYDNSAIAHKQRLINGAAELFVLLEAADLFLFVVWASFPFDRSSIMAFHHRPASAPSRIITQMSLMLRALCQTAHTECDLRPEWMARAHKRASYPNFIFSWWHSGCVYSAFWKQRFSQWAQNAFFLRLRVWLIKVCGWAGMLKVCFANAHSFISPLPE